MERIETRLVHYLGRIREADPKRVSVLADSIKEVGLLNPITVHRRKVIRAGQEIDGFGLIAGMHRFRACQELGWSEIPAVVVDLGEHERIIAECDENLCVSELSPSDRALFTAKRKEAYLALHPETARGTAGAEAKHGRATDNVSFAEDQASKTGSNVRSIQRDASRGEHVSPAALDIIRGTKLDTGRFLDVLKGLGPKEQVSRAQRELASLDRPKPSAPKSAPPAKDDADVHEGQVAALMSAWNKASAEARQDFLGRIDSPLMDRKWA